MCVMEVHGAQRSSTMFQAMSHNTATVVGDVKMLETVLSARKQTDKLASLELAKNYLKRAEAIFIDCFGEAVAAEVGDVDGHVHTHDRVGNERSFVEQAHHDAELARRYETR